MTRSNYETFLSEHGLKHYDLYNSIDSPINYSHSIKEAVGLLDFFHFFNNRKTSGTILEEHHTSVGPTLSINFDIKYYLHAEISWFYLTTIKNFN